MTDPTPPTELRSARWFAAHDLPGFLHRASVKAIGYSRAALDGRPVVGICNPWSEVVNCNVHFRGLAEAVRRGVLAAGGLPLEFPVSSLGENLQKPTTMLFRNLMAMDVEEAIRSYPFDAVVLIGGCDKTQPAQLMGAASADVPAIMLTGRHRRRRPCTAAASCRSAPTCGGTPTSCAPARSPLDEYDELEAAWIPGAGHCNEMGTASTMACVTEALGMTLPGTATIPALTARRAAVSEATGRRAVEIALADLRPSQILTAGRVRQRHHRPVRARWIDERRRPPAGARATDRLRAAARALRRALATHAGAGRRAPAGAHLVDKLDAAGGVPAVLHELGSLLDREQITIGGSTIGECAQPATGAGRPPAVGSGQAGRRARRPARLARAPRRGAQGAPRPTRRCSAIAVARSCSKASTTSPRASTIRRSTSTRTRCSCSATSDRRAPRGCPSGAWSRSPSDCSRPASGTWCASPTRGCRAPRSAPACCTSRPSRTPAVRSRRSATAT